MNFSIKNACLALGLCASTVVSANPTSWYSALFTKAHAGVTATRDNLTDPTPRYTFGDFCKFGLGAGIVTLVLGRYAWKCKKERDEIQVRHKELLKGVKESAAKTNAHRGEYITKNDSLGKENQELKSTKYCQWPHCWQFAKKS